MQINLANTRLFRGMEPSDIEEMLGCLHAKEHAFQKGEIIFPEGLPRSRLAWCSPAESSLRWGTCGAITAS